MNFSQFLIQYVREQFGFPPSQISESMIRAARVAFDNQQKEETLKHGES